MIANKSQVHITALDAYLDTKVIAERLLTLSLTTGCDVIQKNGQRYYGPPQDWTLPVPEKGSEVFIGRIPRDCFEDELVPIFQNIGDIYQIRMMMNFSGFNRGFAFITFANPQLAWKAVTEMNEFEIRPGHKIGVSKSIDNCRLYIGGIPLEMTKFEAWDELRNLVTQTVKNIILYPNLQEPNKNRGFLFAEFENHREAAMAKRQLIPGAVKFWENDVVVDWADPEPDIDPAIMSSIDKLFVRYADSKMSPDYFRHLLMNVIPLESITRIYCTKHYAFLHFNSRLNSEIAKEHLNNAVIEGELLEVQWARPKCFKKQSAVTTNCRSLPPRLRNASMIKKAHAAAKMNQNILAGNQAPLPPNEATVSINTNHTVLTPNTMVNYSHIQNLNFNKMPPPETIPPPPMQYPMHPVYYPPPTQPPQIQNPVFGRFY